MTRCCLNTETISKWTSQNSGKIKAVTATAFVGAAAFTIISIVGAHMPHTHLGSTDASLFFLQHTWTQLVAVGTIALIIGIVLGSLAMSKHLKKEQEKMPPPESSPTTPATGVDGNDKEKESSISVVLAEDENKTQQFEAELDLWIDKAIDKDDVRNPAILQEVKLLKGRYADLFHKSSLQESSAAINQHFPSQASINQSLSSSGFTLLHLAVIMNDINLITALIYKGVLPYTRDIWGNTPVHRAQSPEAVEALCYGVDRGGILPPQKNQRRELPQATIRRLTGNAEAAELARKYFPYDY